MKLTGLIQFIQRQGDTQAELAKALGMNKTTLNYKLNEHGTRALTTADMDAICRRYNILPAQREALFFGKP